MPVHVIPSSCKFWYVKGKARLGNCSQAKLHTSARHPDSIRIVQTIMYGREKNSVKGILANQYRSLSVCMKMRKCHIILDVTGREIGLFWNGVIGKPSRVDVFINETRIAPISEGRRMGPNSVITYLSTLRLSLRHGA